MLQRYLRPLTEALKPTLLQAWRDQRLAQFMDYVNPPENAKILDLGGLPSMWGYAARHFDITIVNLPDALSNDQEHHPPGACRMIEADATDLRDRFADQSFDIVFSNSVIEHVGDEPQQRAFAREVLRLGKAHWIQTPSNHFPIEPHTGQPFYWQMSDAKRQKLQAKWDKDMPLWAEMVRGTRVLTRSQMADLFPDSQVCVEHKFGFEKSYSFYRAYDPQGSDREDSSHGQQISQQTNANLSQIAGQIQPTATDAGPDRTRA
jgi:trans-aconitate methyltransferase